VIRQPRKVDHQGRFLKKETRKAPTSTMTSAFDDEEKYELTALGRQFVHYAMSEIVPRFGW
jgi:hypothetical protein